MDIVPSYSPQARGRWERNFSTWPGRLPQECDCTGSEPWKGPTSFSISTTSQSSTPLHGPSRAARNGIYILPAQESGDGLYAKIRAHR